MVTMATWLSSRGAWPTSPMGSVKDMLMVFSSKSLGLGQTLVLLDQIHDRPQHSIPSSHSGLGRVTPAYL